VNDNLNGKIDFLFEKAINGLTDVVFLVECYAKDTDEGLLIHVANIVFSLILLLR